MNVVATFDPSAKTSGTFSVAQSSANGKMVVYNESNISLIFSFQNGHTAYVPAWTAIMYCGTYGSDTVNWTQQAVMTSTNPPFSYVIVEAYAQGEPVPGTYPAALVRQTNVGNVVNTALGGATSVQNDNNIAGTSVVEATTSSAPSSTLYADNNGVLLVKNYTAGVLSTELDVSSNGVKFAGKLGVVSQGDVLDASGFDTFLAARGTNNEIHLRTGSTDQVTLTSTQLTVIPKSSLDNGAITTDGAGTITIPNNVFLSAKDGSNASHSLIGITSGNDAEIRTTSNNGNLIIATGGGTVIATFNSTTGLTISIGDLTISGHLIMPNNTPLRMKDNSQTAKDILYVDAGNSTTLQMANTASKIYIKDPSGTALMSIDSSGNVRAKGTVTASVTP